MKARKDGPMHGEPEIGDTRLLRELEHLREVNQKTLNSFDLVLALSDSLPSISKLSSPLPIISETLRRIGMLVPFRAMGICLVGEDDRDFTLRLVEPADWHDSLTDEVNLLVDQGVFNWALREKRPVTVPDSRGMERIVLHVIATSSRIRGMFVGVAASGSEEVADTSWSIFSIILQICANNLESFELYRMLHETLSGTD